MALRYLVTMVTVALLSEILPATSFTRYLNNPCLSSPDTCTGKRDGNYPLCYPGCLSGNYIACSGGLGYVMPCPLGWYSNNGGRFLKKMAYDPSRDSCELSTPHCLRQDEWSSPTPITNTPPTTTPKTATSTTTTPTTTTPTTTTSTTTTLTTTTPTTTTPTTTTPTTTTPTTTTPTTTTPTTTTPTTTTPTTTTPTTTTPTTTTPTTTTPTTTTPTTTTPTTTTPTTTTPTTTTPTTTTPTTTTPTTTTPTTTTPTTTTPTTTTPTTKTPTTMTPTTTTPTTQTPTITTPTTTLKATTPTTTKTPTTTTPKTTTPTTTTGPASFTRYLNNPCFSSPDTCTGKRDGNYPFCYPGCLSGNYIACSGGLGYVMPCPLGWYSNNGVRFLKKMAYDPSRDSCELSTSHCLRQDESSPPTPITTTPTTMTPTTTTPTTKTPTTMTPTTTTPTTQTPTITTPTTTLKATTPTTTKTPTTTTPKTTTPTTTTGPVIACVRVAPDCKGIQNGTYPACHPECMTGIYFVCENGLPKQRQCDTLLDHPESSHLHYQSVFDPPTKRCQLRSSSCPRP